MNRFFCPINNISPDKIIISNKEQVHHLRDVLRLKINDKITVFDDKGNEYNCVIDKLSDSVTLNIKERRQASEEKKYPRITIACAIPKRAKFDEIVDKLTQLGTDTIIPLETARVIVKLDRQKKLARQKRWESIALNASQQSQRSRIPVIAAVKDIKNVLLNSNDYDLKIIPTLSGARKYLKEVLTGLSPRNILALIGPEGDFSPEEVNLAKEAGFIPVSLGDSVLRVDTAAIAVVSFIKLYGDR